MAGSGRVVAVCVGSPGRLEVGDREVRTGIHKHPVDGPVTIGALGPMGDHVADSEHHGGPDQAVYVYGAEDYAFWEASLGERLRAGTFGENVLVEGFDLAAIRVGDRLRMQGVTLEVTAPRIPCSVLAARVGDPGFVKRFRDAGRPGVYTRVVREGTLRVGDPVELELHTGPTISIAALYAEWYARPHDAATLERALAAPVARRTRERLSEWRAAIDGN